MISLSLRFPAIILIVLASYGCSSDQPAGGDWVEANKKLVIISPSFDQTAEGKYLKVIYENFSEDTIRKLKYELIATEAGKTDTTEREIILKKRLKPKDQHLVDRAQTEKPVTYETVETGRVWIVKD